jgi:uncharacterized membrane protein YphA (DoxX/SURF4 family)
MGVVVAWAIMIVQVSCSLALIFQRLIVPARIGHIVILGVGIGLVHASEGWFVVGPGRNGIEYIVLLIMCVFSVLWAYWPRVSRSRLTSELPEVVVGMFIYQVSDLVIGQLSEKRMNKV